VVFKPAGATDKEVLAKILALLLSEGIAGEETYTTPSLPDSRMAPPDLYFHQIPSPGVLLDLMAHPSAKPVVATPVSSELCDALGLVVVELLHERGHPVPLLNEIQAESAPMPDEASSCHGRP
jgi:hypothetical protein